MHVAAGHFEIAGNFRKHEEAFGVACCGGLVDGAVLILPTLADQIPELGVGLAEVVIDGKIRLSWFERRFFFGFCFLYGFWIYFLPGRLAGFLSGFGQFLLCRLHLGPERDEVVLLHVVTRGGGVGVGRQLQGFYGRRETGQYPRDAGFHEAGLVRVLGVASNVEVGGCVEVVIEHAREAVLLEIGFAGHGVEADLMGLEDGPEAVVVLMGDRVVFMIVALGTIKGEADKGLGSVLDGGVQPGSTIEEVVVAGEKAGGPQGVVVVGRQLVGSKHFLNHAVEALAVVEGFDDPVAPMPDVLLAVAQLFVEAVPVAVAPDVHPVPSPAFAILGTGEQFIDDGFPRSAVI